MNKPCSIRLDSDKVERFKRLYPDLLGKYLNECLSLALQDKDLFIKILFKELKK